MKIIGSILGFVVVIFVLSLLFCRGIYVSPDRSMATLEKSGFTEVQVKSRNIFFVGLQGCGKDDVVGFNASAINAAGDRVDIMTCHGFFKGGTIRA